MKFMKKLFLMLVALFATVTMFAQEKQKPLEPQPFYKTMYFGFSTDVYGYASPQYNGYENFRGSIGGGFDLRLGKNITPKFGTELEFALGIPNNDESIHHLDLGLNFTANMNNIIHGFKGQADKVEVVPFVGLGWERYLRTNDLHSSDIYGKGGIQLNVNLRKGWQFNAIPYVQYRLTESKKAMISDYPRLTVNNMRVGLELGFTYKFGDFKFTELAYTQADVDELNGRINDARRDNDQLTAQMNGLSDDNKKLTDEIVELNKREMTQVTEYNVMPVIQFPIGKATIDDLQRASLEQLAIFLIDNKDVEVGIIGHADAQTGTVDRNQQLSELRAQAVKDALVEMGVSSNRMSTVGTGDTEQPFQANDSNRVVLFVEGK